MKDIKKGLTRLVGVAMSIGITCSVIMMAGCKDKGTVVGAEGFSLQAFSDVNTGREYDSKYFYRNDLNVFGGDADVIYVSEEESEEYVILKYGVDENGEDILETIEDDEEFDRIADIFDDEFSDIFYDEN